MKYLFLIFIFVYCISNVSAATLIENGDGTWNNDTYDHTTEDGGDGYIKTGLFADNMNDNSLNGWTSSSGVTVVSTSKGYSAYINSGDILQKDISTASNMSFLYSVNFTQDSDSYYQRLFIYNSATNLLLTAFRADYDYYDNAAYQTISTSTNNVWYTVRTDASFSTNLSHFYLDGLLKLSDIAFRLDGASMTHYQHECSSGFPNPGYVDDVRVVYTDQLYGNFTENLTSFVGVGEEIANVSFNSTSATGIISIDLYGSIDNTTYVLIQSNASDDTVYDVSGDSYEYIRYKLVSTQINQTMFLYNTTIWIDTTGIAAPSITSYAPATPNSSYANVDKTFNFTTDQTGNHTYWMNGNLVQTNTSVTTSTYTNLSANNKGLFGLHNLTMKVENTNGTDTQKIDWTTLENYVTTNITYDDRTNLSYNRIFDIITITPGVENISIGYGNTDSGNSYGLYFSNGTQIASTQTATSDNKTVWFNDTVAVYVVANDYFINETLGTASDTKFEYWTGSSWVEDEAQYYLWFTCFWWTPECDNEEQSDSQATLKITNNGTASGIPKMKLNESAPAGIKIYVDDDNTFAGAVELSNTYQAVSTSLSQDTNVTLWAWANLSGASAWEFETYAIVE